MNIRAPYSRYTSIIILFAFLANMLGPVPLAQAQEFRLPAPGVRVGLSPEFNPPILKGIKVHPDNPFHFDFILDKGDTLPLLGRVREGELKQESTRLIKYFLASLTIPEKDLWVNLSPYEKDRIIPQSFGLTEMGRDLLAEDYMLKQITASLIYPEGEVGKKFWKRIYEESVKKFGTTNIPVNTFNKVWIVPEKAVVYENAKAGTAYVVESKLKVMLEQDYLALSKHAYGGVAERGASPAARNEVRTDGETRGQDPDINKLGSDIVRAIVIPELTKEVNEGKNFAQLRQVYNSLILATWYKKKIKDSILIQVYEDKNKVAGVGYKDSSVEAIYQRYLQAFKKGVYNYIKEEPDPLTQETISRKYFSGGEELIDIDKAMSITSNSNELPQGVNDEDKEIVTVNLMPEHQGISHIEDIHTPAGISMLQVRLLLSNNKQAEKTSEAIELAVKQGKQIIVEIGSGNTANALKLAQNNPEALVLATDKYDSNPQTASPEYLPYGVDFEAGTLPAQKAKLDNLIVIRSVMDILLYLPDASIDSVVFVRPPITVLKDLITLVKKSNILKKLRPGGKIAVVGRDVMDSLYVIADRLHFNKQNDEIFEGVDLGKNSAWEEDYRKGGLYLAEVNGQQTEGKRDNAQLAADKAMLEGESHFNLKTLFGRGWTTFITGRGKIVFTYVEGKDDRGKPAFVITAVHEKKVIGYIHVAIDRKKGYALLALPFEGKDKFTLNKTDSIETITKASGVGLVDLLKPLDTLLALDVANGYRSWDIGRVLMAAGLEAVRRLGEGKIENVRIKATPESVLYYRKQFNAVYVSKTTLSIDLKKWNGKGRLGIERDRSGNPVGLVVYDEAMAAEPRTLKSTKTGDINKAGANTQLAQQSRDRVIINSPFPNLTPNTSISVRKLMREFHSKYGIRNILRGGPISQPPFFKAIKRNQEDLKEVQQIKGEEGPFNDKSYDPLFADPADEISFEEIIDGVASGTIELPIIFKPNLSIEGTGIFRVEKDPNNHQIYYITLAYVEDRLLLGEQAINFKNQFYNQSGIIMAINKEQGIMLLTVDSKKTNIKEVLVKVWKLMSQHKSNRNPSYDSGVVESLMPVVLYKQAGSRSDKGFAYETRHAFKGNSMGRFDHNKRVTWSFARIGTSSEFSNQSGRNEEKTLSYGQMLDPLIEIFHIPLKRRTEFMNYVDGLIQEEFEYFVKRLKRAGVIFDLNLHGQFDLMWLNKVNEEGFPVPVLIEADIVTVDKISHLKLSPVIGFVDEVKVDSEMDKIKKGNNIHIQFPIQVKKTKKVTGVMETSPWSLRGLVRLSSGQFFDIDDVTEILVDGNGKKWIPPSNSESSNDRRVVRDFLDRNFKSTLTITLQDDAPLFQDERGEVLEVPSLGNGDMIKYKTDDGQEKTISISALKKRKARVFLVDSGRKVLRLSEDDDYAMAGDVNNKAEAQSKPKYQAMETGDREKMIGDLKTKIALTYFENIDNKGGWSMDVYSTEKSDFAGYVIKIPKVFNKKNNDEQTKKRYVEIVGFLDDSLGFIKDYMGGVIAPFIVLKNAVVNGEEYPRVIVQKKLTVVYSDHLEDLRRLYNKKQLQNKSGKSFNQETEDLITKMIHRSILYDDSITPVNLGLDENDGAIYLIDFGHPRKVNKEDLELSNPLMVGKYIHRGSFPEIGILEERGEKLINEWGVNTDKNPVPDVEFKMGANTQLAKAGVYFAWQTYRTMVSQNTLFPSNPDLVIDFKKHPDKYPSMNKIFKEASSVLGVDFFNLIGARLADIDPTIVRIGNVLFSYGLVKEWIERGKISLKGINFTSGGVFPALLLADAMTLKKGLPFIQHCFDYIFSKAAEIQQEKNTVSVTLKGGPTEDILNLIAMIVLYNKSKLQVTIKEYRSYNLVVVNGEEEAVDIVSDIFIHGGESVYVKSGKYYAPEFMGDLIPPDPRHQVVDRHQDLPVHTPVLKPPEWWDKEVRDLELKEPRFSIFGQTYEKFSTKGGKPIEASLTEALFGFINTGGAFEVLAQVAPKIVLVGVPNTFIVDVKEGVPYNTFVLRTPDQSVDTEQTTFNEEAQKPKRGGIDLTPANMNLQVKKEINTSEGIQFHLDPAMLEQLQNAPGFVPVIINIQPLNNLRQFLGVERY